MASTAFKHALGSDFPVLFVNIGWAINYDGTETIVGNHKWLKTRAKEAKNAGESRAFAKVGSNGYFSCGIGDGDIAHEQFHIAFVSRDKDQLLKVVGVYAAAEILSQEIGGWCVAQTRFAERFPVGKRPLVPDWPGGQGMRRWATRSGARGSEHKKLLTLFQSVTKSLSSAAGLPEAPVGVGDDEDGSEGQQKRHWVLHRKRERQLRQKKIEAAMKMNHGRLVCEVKGCGFDFRSTYGELGAGFAEVHHKKQLSDAPRTGQAVPLSELAVVCANCHRMIHHHGQCRPLESLIPA